MTVCSKCGVELKKDAKFCKACGSGQQDGAKRDAKKARVLAGEKKGGKTVMIAAVAAIAIAAGVAFALLSGRTGPAGASGSSSIVFTPVSAEGGVVKLAVNEIKGSAVHYYVYSSGDKEVKFFALRASDGTIRVALDACQACYRAKLGYHQQGDTMVCNNCGIAFRSADIGVIRGGCNPIPVDHTDDANLILVKAKDLDGGAQYF